jgi:hypothetical protein
MQEVDDIGVELGVTIQNHVAMAARFREGFAELLDHPLRGWMASHIAVQDHPSSMLDDKETIEQLERHGRHSEGVHRHDHLTVVLQEGQPTLL